MFSIVIPLYNKEKYITRTLQSVLKQTLQDFEIIIVDDGSTDASVKEVEKFKDNRIHIFKQQNAGVSVARNRGVKEAKYNIIAFLDADDEWYTNHLSELYDLKIDFPECHVFATNYKIVDSEKNERFPVNTDLIMGENRGTISNYFKVASKTAPPLWSSAIAVDKKALKSVDEFPVGVPMGEDLLTWARLACNYSIAYNKTVTAVYNVGRSSELSTSSKKSDSIDVVSKELRKLIDNCCLSNISIKRYIALWHKMRLKEAMRRGAVLSCFKEIKEIIRFDKKQYKSYIMLFLAFLPHSIRELILKTIKG